MINTGQSISIIAVVAVCTVITRALPFAVFGGKNKVPPFIQYLGNFLPPAIMVTLVVYCLKGISFTTAAGCLPEIIAVAVTAALHIWKKNILLTVGAGTVCYMILVQLVFR